MPVDARPTPEIFRLAVEASPSGMIAVNGDGTIIMINGEIERLFGYARDELLGRPVDILLPDEVRAKHAIQRSG
jgi:PAS domain S-box-containing protein